MIIHGNMLDVLPTLPADSIDSCFTDPPYHLTTAKRFASTALDSETDSNARRARDRSDALARLSRGFMGKAWDGGDVAFRPETWRHVLRILKPGAHLMATAGTRTYHRMACAIEDAGFEIRDMFGWIYGSGFPKSHDAGNGWGTAVKPALEPIVFARKPLSESSVAANIARWGTGAINIDASRVPTDDNTTFDRIAGNRSRENYRTGTTTGARVPTSTGRFPANIQHDGSPETLAIFPTTAGARGVVRGDEPSDPHVNVYGKRGRVASSHAPDGSGSAARFFYCPKASTAERAGSSHPTVKPLDLVRYYVTMITPVGGTVLDPFAGTGTTLQAARDAGFNAIGVEMEREYFLDIKVRMRCIAPRAHDLLGPLQDWDYLP